MHKSYQVSQAFAARPAPTRRRPCHIVFQKRPLELIGDGRLQRVLLMRNNLVGEPGHQVAEPTGEVQQLDCGLLFRSIGYCALAIPGVPFDSTRGAIPNNDGRVLNGSAVVPWLYVSGWIKRGPSGIIGTNREDSVLTVTAMLADLPSFDAGPKPGADHITALLRQRGIRISGVRTRWRSPSPAAASPTGC
ncbi:MAG TPA: hypothetical protein VMU81_09095 [Acetobacteraceae bacterium]|nr:hypothetical protein [Acetobacteraceae bacterium]